MKNYDLSYPQNLVERRKNVNKRKNVGILKVGLVQIFGIFKGAL